MESFEQIIDDIEARNNEFFETYFSYEDVVVEIISWIPISPATRNSPAEGGEVEIVIYDDCGEDITNNISENFPHDYSRIKDKAYSIVVLSKGD